MNFFIIWEGPLKNHGNVRKSRFVHAGTMEKKEDNEENEKDVEDRMKSIRRRHTLIGKKNYDDHELAKIDLNCMNLFIFS